MTITPHRDAAADSVAQVRRKRAEQGTTDPVLIIAHRMDTDVSEALLLGAADMLDIQVSAGRIGNHVNEALAAALGSFLLTIAGGNEGLAATCVDLSLTDLRKRTLERIRAARTQAIVGRASVPRGRA